METNKNSIIIAGITILLAVILFGALAVYIGDIAVDRENYEITDYSSSSNFIATSLTNTLSPVEEGITSSSVQTYQNVSLDFDGVDDKIEINNAFSFPNQDLKTFTIHAFIQRNESNRLINGDIVTKFYTIDNQRGVAMSILNNKSYLACGNNTGESSSVKQTSSGSYNVNNGSVGEQMLITGTWSGTVLKSLINGVPQGSVSTSECLNSSRLLEIGNGRRNAFFNGSIDEVIITSGDSIENQAKVIYDEKVGNLGIRIPIVYFHHIYENCSTGADLHLGMCGSNFSIFMDYLNDEGFETVTIKNYLDWRNRTYVMPNKPIILQFDDGFEDVYTNASIKMEEFGFVGVYAIITGKVGTNNHSNWTQINDLISRGWEISSHTTGDVAMTSYNSTRRDYELSTSKAHILGNTTQPDVYSFVFPANSLNQTLLNECNAYYEACTDNEAWQYSYYWYKNTDLNTYNKSLMRKHIGYNTSTLDDFKNVISPLQGDIIIHLNLNENTGTIAYDTSGNNNHGTISGATWKNDGVLISIVGYTLNTATGVLILPASYLYDYVVSSWSYENIAEYGFHIAIIKLIAGFVCLIVLSVSIVYLTKLFNKED